MLYRVRFHVIFLSSVLLFCWILLPFFKTNDQGYSIHDFDEDMNKAYFQIGSSSQNRGDFLKAIRYYETALKHRPDDSVCLQKLEFCVKKIKKSFKNLT